jgi:hypothetical protein
MVVAVLLASMLAAWGGEKAHAAPARRPNILFVIMDDVGIDQMKVFGYGGTTPPSTPNLALIAGAGIRFHNAWAMPACSTSRALFFTARFPFPHQCSRRAGPRRSGRLDGLTLRDDHAEAICFSQQACVDTTTTEFYGIDESVPVPRLDRAGAELPLDALTPEQQKNYSELSAQLTTLLASQLACPGDGNIDFVVN